MMRWVSGLVPRPGKLRSRTVRVAYFKLGGVYPTEKGSFVHEICGGEELDGQI
jgi:hypothetical protein